MVGSLNCEPLGKIGQISQMNVSRWQVEVFSEGLLVSVLRGEAVSLQHQEGRR